MTLNLLDKVFFLLCPCAILLISTDSLTLAGPNQNIDMYTSKGQCAFKEYNPTKVLHLDPNAEQKILADGFKSNHSNICTVTFAIKPHERLKLSMEYLEIKTCNMTASLYLLLERNKLEKRVEYNCNTSFYHQTIYLNGGPYYYGILEINKRRFQDMNFTLVAKVMIIPETITNTQWPTTLIRGQSSTTKRTSLKPSSKHTLLLAIGIVVPLILLVASAFTYHVWHRGQQRLSDVNRNFCNFSFFRIWRQRRNTARSSSRNPPQAPQPRIRTIADLYGGDPFDFLAWEEFFGCFSSMDFPKPVELPPYPGLDSPPSYESVVNETQGLETTTIQPPPPPAPAPSVHQLRHQSAMVAVLSTNPAETVQSPSGMETTV